MMAAGRVTVPRVIRDRLGLEPGDKMAFMVAARPLRASDAHRRAQRELVL
jgi:bifunctional DNA-binding transcriptional regulator/antitoxin component of YhaV-PrlF toxin-antitoxin module